MKIASWNVNSIKARLPHVLKWLEDNSPDVLLIQELKTIEENFPKDEFSKLGYDSAIFGQKAWNGVAIISKHEITDIKKALDGDSADEQSRYIEATVKGVRIASIYLPNGNPVDTEKYPYKLKWMDRLYSRIKELLATERPLVFGGDYNIIPHNDDCYDPNAWKDDALFKLGSRKKFRKILNLGLTDAFRTYNNGAEQYSFWGYQGGAWQKNNGLRIDHFLLSPQATDILKNCTIDKTPRDAEKASDHVPIIIELE